MAEFACENIANKIRKCSNAALSYFVVKEFEKWHHSLRALYNCFVLELVETEDRKFGVIVSQQIDVMYFFKQQNGYKCYA